MLINKFLHPPKSIYLLVLLAVRSSQVGFSVSSITKTTSLIKGIPRYEVIRHGIHRTGHYHSSHVGSFMTCLHKSFVPDLRVHIWAVQKGFGHSHHFMYPRLGCFYYYLRLFTIEELLLMLFAKLILQQPYHFVKQMPSAVRGLKDPQDLTHKYIHGHLNSHHVL